MAEEQEPKPVEWVGSSLDNLRQFPEEVQDEVGFALFQAQRGEKAKMCAQRPPRLRVG
jgi:phage-related protein